MNIKQILLRSISIMYSIIILMGCGGGEQQTGGGLQEAKGGKFKGGIYRANEMAELRSLDPVGVNDATSHHIADQIYETLLTYDGDLRLQPELAESWEVSPDGMSYTYRLRKGVKFHDDPCFKNGKGRELTAQDVVYSFTRICDARTRTLGAEYFKEKVRGAKEYYDASIEAQANNAPIKVSGIPGFVAVDNYTFRIDLVKPFAPFEFYVTLGVTLIHPKEAVEKYGKDFFQHPVGTGPFKFVSWSPERECVLTRNTHYWGKDKDGNQLPYLDGITFSFMKDITNQFVACKNGNLEESYRIPSEFFEDVVDQNKKVKPAYANYKVLNIPALSTQYYGMLYSGKVFGNINLRKALNMGIDRSQIRKFVLKSQSAGPGIHGLVPPTMVDYNGTQIKGYDFD
ncbi:MAG: ABC transporter substrate-binding protein, partial [Ignavibacteria bacterium]|nr:ABC transporter substrate-binding protein [Ignavibacteria bacterium]